MANRITRRRLLQTLGSTGVVLGTGCGSKLSSFAFDAGSGAWADAPEEGLRVQYIGVGCFLIQWGQTAVLTDPFWSHLPLHRVAFGHIAPDPEQIDPHLPPLDDVQAVLVGHTHYDHVLDLPYVAPMMHPDAKVFGSETLQHLYAAEPVARPIVPVDEHLASADEPGQWLKTANERVRILPLRSGHPDQYLFFHFFQGDLETPRETPPTRAHHFLEGLTLAWLIDFLDANGRIAQRVYVQTSSRGVPDGLLPPGVKEEHPVDVALVAMDCANRKAQGKPNVIDELNPREVIFCHWEDFFRPKTKPPREIVKVNLPALRKALPNEPDRTYRFPSWGSVFQFSSPSS